MANEFNHASPYMESPREQCEGGRVRTKEGFDAQEVVTAVIRRKGYVKQPSTEIASKASIFEMVYRGLQQRGGFPIHRPRVYMILPRVSRLDVLNVLDFQVQLL